MTGNNTNKKNYISYNFLMNQIGKDRKFKSNIRFGKNNN